jgi:CDP-diacylglycerol--glycerol-3-phosphate 3-phosphatidyltransferase
MAISPAGITVANYIGLSRILLWTPLATAFVLLQRWDAAFAAILLAGISDMADGYVARREKTISNFGAFLDLTADKVFVTAMLVCLSYQGLVPLWAVLIILLREFFVMGLRCYAAAERVSIPVDRIGRSKCFFTFAAILAIVLNLPFAPQLLIVACALTVVSGAMYFYRARPLLARYLRYSTVDAPARIVEASMLSLPFRDRVGAVEASSAD